MKFFLGFVLSYLIGSLPTAYLVARTVRGIDIREYGSGNVGATNVFRVVGKKWGIGVLILDALKGFLSVSLLPLYFSSPSVSPFATGLVYGIAAIIGHTWTGWLRFRGGKGVATSLGVFLALTPLATATSLAVWAVVFAWKRYVSLASLGTALFFPLWVFCFYRNREFFPFLLPVSFCLTVFIFYTHRENLRRLREGKEGGLI
jgi:glycerol-3-phosphate acyltransferase PlsY